MHNFRQFKLSSHVHLLVHILHAFYFLVQRIFQTFKIIINIKIVLCNIILYRSGLGNHYGTLGGPVGAFSPQSRPSKAAKSSGKNFLTNPGKKGTGFG